MKSTFSQSWTDWLLLFALLCPRPARCDDPKPAPTTADAFTKQSLLELGFVERRGVIFELPVMPVEEAARLLGFRLADMRPTVNQSPFMDKRVVIVRGHYFIVESRRTNREGLVVSNSLDDPTCPARVGTAITQVKPRTYKPTQNKPRLTLHSAILSGGVIVVVLEVAAGDKAGPLAIWTDDLSLTWASETDPRHLGRLTFGKVRGGITLQPGEAKRLRGWVGLDHSVPAAARNGGLVRVDLKDKKGPFLDYHWWRSATSNTQPLRSAASRPPPKAAASRPTRKAIGPATERPKLP